MASAEKVNGDQVAPSEQSKPQKNNFMLDAADVDPEDIEAARQLDSALGAASQSTLATEAPDATQEKRHAAADVLEEDSKGPLNE